MLVYKNNDITIFNFKNVTLLSSRMQHLEKIFKHIPIVVYYTENSNSYISMDDVSVACNDIDYEYNYDINYKTMESIIDALYLKLYTNQLNILDKKLNKYYKIPKEIEQFTIPIQNSYSNYLTFWK